MANIITSVLKEKCPFCGEAHIFKKTRFLQVPQMQPYCPACKRDLTGEPGYFFGAMYVSYAIAVFIGLVAFLLCWFIFRIHTFYVLITIISSLVLLISYKNFKWSRIIWLKLFPPGENTNFYKKWQEENAAAKLKNKS